MSRPNNDVQRARLILVLISLGIMLDTTVATVDAQTSAETGVSVTIVSEGALDITWVTTETTFLVDGEAPALRGCLERGETGRILVSLPPVSEVCHAPPRLPDRSHRRSMGDS